MGPRRQMGRRRRSAPDRDRSRSTARRAPRTHDAAHRLAPVRAGGADRVRLFVELRAHSRAWSRAARCRAGWARSSGSNWRARRPTSRRCSASIRAASTLVGAQWTGLWLDALGFIPSYTAFLILAAIAASRGRLRRAIVAMLVVAGLSDEVEGLVMGGIMKALPGHASATRPALLGGPHQVRAARAGDDTDRSRDRPARRAAARCCSARSCGSAAWRRSTASANCPGR